MFDVLTTGAVAQELRSTILDGRIQRLGMVNPLTIGMEIYAHHRRWHLIASADADNPRVHLLPTMPSADPNVITPFSLQLRKYVRGGFLIDVAQQPLERIIRLTIAKRMGPADDPEPEPDTPDDEPDIDDIWTGDNVSRLNLVIEIMGRHANLILVDDEGLVRESAKRVTPHMSRVRPVLPKRRYEPPPPPDKPDPRRLTTPSVEPLLAAAKPGDKLADLLVRGFRGMSPQIAREAVFRLTGDVTSRVRELDPARAQEIAQTIRGLFQPLVTNAWEPHAYVRDDVVIGYGAIPITSLAAEADDRPLSSISQAITDADGARGDDTPQDHAQRRDRLVQAIDSATSSVRTRLYSLEQQYERSRDTERLRRWGEAIYASLWQIAPGDAELITTTEIGEERIPLDPQRDPKEVAAEYFEDYRKSQKAGSALPERMEEARNELAWLTDLRQLAQNAEGFAGIETIREELEEHTGGRHTPQEKAGHTRRKPTARRVRPITDDDGNLIYIGKSSRENEQVTFDIAAQQDWWFHARGVPGSHVIVRPRVPTDELDEEAALTAASLAAWYSGGRESGSVEVDITQRKDVRKIRGAGPGMVTYRNERTIAVRPSDERALREANRIE